jgi:hypothetical protein
VVELGHLARARELTRQLFGAVPEGIDDGQLLGRAERRRQRQVELALPAVEIEETLEPATPELARIGGISARVEQMPQDSRAKLGVLGGVGRERG